MLSIVDAMKSTKVSRTEYPTPIILLLFFFSATISSFNHVDYLNCLVTKLPNGGEFLTLKSATLYDGIDYCNG